MAFPGVPATLSEIHDALKPQVQVEILTRTNFHDLFHRAEFETAADPDAGLSCREGPRELTAASKAESKRSVFDNGFTCGVDQCDSTRNLESAGSVHHCD